MRLRGAFVVPRRALRAAIAAGRAQAAAIRFAVGRAEREGTMERIRSAWETRSASLERRVILADFIREVVAALMVEYCISTIFSSEEGVLPIDFQVGKVGTFVLRQW